MKKRFTERYRRGRGSIPKKMRLEIYERDGYTCQFCDKKFVSTDLTIDHLIPLAHGGVDEVTNYVTCCRSCNTRKSDMPLTEFARTVNVSVDKLPVHGDPIIDNEELPIEVRLIRKGIFDRIRKGKISVSGSSGKNKLEKTYRREFWATPLGKKLEAEEPSLPGQVRIMLPEIKTIAKTPREHLLLLELAKSANTRNLIGTVLTVDVDVEAIIRSMAKRDKDESLTKRLNQAIRRFERVLRKTVTVQ